MNDFEVKIHKMGSGYIQVKFNDPKTGARRRKRFHTLKEAKDYKKRMEDRVNSKGVNAFSDLRISEAMKNYLQKFPASNVRSRKNHFKSFVDTFGIYKVSELGSTDIRKWVLDRKLEGDLSDKTLNNICSQFYGFFQYLTEEDYLKNNPIKSVRFNRYANPKRPRIVLAISEVREILNNAKTFSPKILYPYISCIAHTGARRGEIVGLNRKDVDFKTGLIHLRQTKNGRERFVRISPELERVLKEHLDSHDFQPVFINKEGKRLNKNGELARLINKFKEFFPMDKEDWGNHSFRHSFAYNFLKKGGRMYQLQAILGHRSIEVTVDLYGQLQAQDIECPSPYEE